LGVGGLGVGPHPPLPNPQSPIPNPQFYYGKKDYSKFGIFK